MCTERCHVASRDDKTGHRAAGFWEGTGLGATGLLVKGTNQPYLTGRPVSALWYNIFLQLLHRRCVFFLPHTDTNTNHAVETTSGAASGVDVAIELPRRH